MNHRLSAAVLMVLAALALPLTLGAQAPGNTGGARASTLQPGDQLRVLIWREDDLSGDFLVDERGLAVLPLLGAQPVVGLDVETLRQRLQALYAAHIENPSLTITPMKRIFVLGEIARPGVQYVDPTVGVATAVALAGGVTAQGTQRWLRIVRQSGEELRVELAGRERLPELMSGDEIHIPQRPWAQRNSSLLVSMAVGTLTSIVLAILIANQ